MTPLGEAERVNDVVLFALGLMGFKTESSPKYRQKHSHSNVSSTHRPEEDDIPPLVAIITAFRLVVCHALVRPLLDFVHDWMKNAITQNNAHLERDDDSS